MSQSEINSFADEVTATYSLADITRVLPEHIRRDAEIASIRDSHERTGARLDRIVELVADAANTGELDRIVTEDDGEVA